MYVLTPDDVIDDMPTATRAGWLRRRRVAAAAILDGGADPRRIARARAFAPLRRLTSVDEVAAWLQPPDGHVGHTDGAGATSRYLARVLRAGRPVPGRLWAHPDGYGVWADLREPCPAPGAVAVGAATPDRVEGATGEW